MNTSNDDCLQRAMDGDSESIGRLLREHAPRLREVLSIDKRWQSILDIDDVLQVTYMEAFIRIHSFKPGGPNAFFGWLHRIAENNLRDAVRGLDAQKRPPPAMQVAIPTSDNSMIALLDLLGVTSRTPSQSAAAGEIKTILDTALSALPADYASVVRQYDLECRPIAEVSAAVGRSAGAVHMLRARAHDRLRELLGPDSNFFSSGA